VRFSRELTIGAALIAALVALVLATRLLSGLPALGGTTHAFTLLDDAAGVGQGSPVVVSGMPVGTVTDVSLTPDRRVRVDFEVTDEADLRADAVARPGGLAALGGVSLALDPGTAPQPLPPGGQVRAGPSADLLGLATERAPDLIAQMDTLIRVVTQAARTADALAASSADDAQATLATLRRTTATLDAFLSENRDGLGRLVVRTDALVGSLGDFATPTRRDTLAVVLDRLARLLATGQGALDRSAPTLDGLGRTSARADTLLALLTTGDGSAARALRDDSLYVKLDTTLTRINRILADIERDPGRYLRHLDLVDLF
jgi:phospholipid/cholesterol/gamma-HCH transport system substrate-binding protein